MITIDISKMGPLPYHSATSISTFEACEMKFYFEYVLRYRQTNKPDGLKNGQLMHEGEELYTYGNNLNCVIQMVNDLAKKSQWDEDELFMARLRSYIRGYYNAWSDHDAELFQFARDDMPYEILGVEVEFEHLVPSAHGAIKFIGKIDAVILNKEDDCILLKENKNVKAKADVQDPTSQFWRSLPMNNQITIYADYLQKEYKKPVQLWYDVVVTSPSSRPKIIDKKTKERESVEEFEQRLTQTYIDESEERYVRKKIPLLEENISQRMDEIIRIATAANEISVPVRNTQSCKNYGGCPFFNCCIGSEEIEESTRFTQLEPRSTEGEKNEAS